MPAGRKTPSGAKQAAQTKVAATAWNKFTQQSSKAFVDQLVAEDPQVLIQVEKFLRSNVWKDVQSDSSNKVARFCRGRTQNGKIPPTFMIENIVSLSGGAVEADD
eukprot:5459162-Lingulodinium_polyedra.AAC.1